MKLPNPNKMAIVALGFLFLTMFILVETVIMADANGALKLRVYKLEQQFYDYNERLTYLENLAE